MAGRVGMNRELVARILLNQILNNREKICKSLKSIHIVDKKPETAYTIEQTLSTANDRHLLAVPSIEMNASEYQVLILGFSENPFSLRAPSMQSIAPTPSGSSGVCLHISTKTPDRIEGPSSLPVQTPTTAPEPIGSDERHVIAQRSEPTTIDETEDSIHRLEEMLPTPPDSEFFHAQQHQME